MDQQTYLIELIEEAQRGSKECLEKLALQAKDRLRTYVFRVTQQEDLTQEIVQETLLEMFKVIGKLRRADRFWPWLYGIAINKLRRFYRTETTHRRVAESSILKKGSPGNRQDGLEDLVSEELKQIVSGAMKKLKARHKAVLIMRCYDDMPYSEIAESMGCSEFSTRMLFVRAKRALEKELSRNGFGKGSLLAALLIFGKMTAPSKAIAAQITVTTASIQAGLLASTVGLATTKAAIVTVAAVGALTTGTVVMKTDYFNQNAQNPNSSTAITQEIDQVAQDDANEEYRYFFPQGLNGPLMLKAKYGIGTDQSSWQTLQNQYGNYQYKNNQVQINNYHIYADDMSVLEMPTDDPAMLEFISQVEGKMNNIQHVSAKGKGLLVIASRNKITNGEHPWVIRHENVLEEDYFRADWPSNARVFDNRDQMHQRGWTYFEVTGRINGRRISGSGRIPFVYESSKDNSPWLKLQVGDITIVDTSREAYVYKPGNERMGLYNGNSFFKGLARPWMGLHAIDTVRRDAAEQRIPFTTKHNTGDNYALVELNYEGVNFTYNIDLETDVIDEITFSDDKGNTGNLKFTYLQTIDEDNGDFEIPKRPRRQTTSRNSQGLLWLKQPLEGEIE